MGRSAASIWKPIGGGGGKELAKENNKELKNACTILSSPASGLPKKAERKK